MGYTLKYKKGQDVNLLFAIVIFLALGIVIVAGFRVVKELNTAVSRMPTATQEAKDITQRVETNYVLWFDILFLIIFVLVFIALIASAFFIDTHPIFFIISMIMVVITGFIGGYIANAYSSFAETPTIQPDASSFVIIPYIFSHYIAIIVVVGIVTLIALFAKLRGGG